MKYIEYLLLYARLCSKTLCELTHFILTTPGDGVNLTIIIL